MSWSRASSRYGEQGGNYRFELDIEHNTVWFYPKAKVALPLQIKLGKKSNYRELLEALQFRCTWHRDIPFTVSLTSTHLSISWDEKVEPLKRKTNSDPRLQSKLFVQQGVRGVGVQNGHRSGHQFECPP